jgi:integrase
MLLDDFQSNKDLKRTLKMPKIPTPLQDTTIKKAKPKKDKDYTLADGKGLHLLIKTSGVKIWEFVFISPLTKKRRKKSLGSYPDVTLKAARDIRSNNLMLLSDNIDPVEYEKEVEQKEKANNNGLFENVMNEWFERQKKQLAKVTYDRKYQVFISSVLPYFKDKHIKDITKLELLHLLEEKEKTAKETASRLFNYLSNLWAYAVLKDYCEYNFLSNINKNDVLVEKRVVNNYAKITDETILKELVNKTYNYVGSHSIKNALKFVLHIPLRAYNLCYLKWAYIDFDNKLLTIPRDLMKVKNHNLPDFQLPLTDEVINILTEQKEFCTKYAALKEFVFVGNDNVNPINRESPNQALTRMGFTAEKKQSLHSFRGTFRTIVEEKQEDHNISEKIMESILDHHKDTKVEKAYKNKVSYLEQQKPLMNWWSDYIMSLKD